MAALIVLVWVALIPVLVIVVGRAWARRDRRDFPTCGTQVAWQPEPETEDPQRCRS